MAAPGNDNFLNKQTILAIVLTAGLLFGWQSYMGQKYSKQTAKTALEFNQKPAAVVAPVGTLDGRIADAEKASVGTATHDTLSASSGAVREETFTSFENENWKFEVSSIGMRVRNIVLKAYKDRALKPVVLAPEKFDLFETTAGESEQPIYFELQHSKPNEFVGVGKVGTATVTKTLIVDSTHYSLKTSVVVAGDASAVKSLNVSMPEQIVDVSGGSFLRPSLDRQSLYVSHADATEREVINPAKPFEEKKFNLGMVDVVSTGGLYFASAIVDQSNVRPDMKSHYNANEHRLETSLNYPRLDQKDGFKVDYTTFAGPKALDLLKEVDPKLGAIVDFGMFGIIARPMLWLMKWLFSFVGNYGVAIILLTLLVRLIVLPFNVMSFRSMKVMAALNPQMKELRKKHEKDPARMNLEIAALLKENKANPLGGCLPMLLQMPVFFALYRVLGNSIELYQAPFALWIQDLSLKDPFYVLPVLMGISMFIQQKLTPNTMDPQQAKMMAFMPLIFAGMMTSLPSGLTLYIFVSTLFGITQQKILMGDRSVEKTTVQVKA